MDTDTLIALVESLLPQDLETPSQGAILDALVRSNGDVSAAVDVLHSKGESGVASGSKKRKLIGLDNWLTSTPSSHKAKRANTTSPAKKTRITTPYPIDSSIGSKPEVNLMSILRQPPPNRPRQGLVQPPSLALTTPTLVAKHTPCTLHLSVLPPELACRLFYVMTDLSTHWKKNKWWLFDRVVESPHLTSFYARKTDGLDDDETWQEAAQYWYNGRMTVPPALFPPEMEEACKIVEQVVNVELKQRKRYKREWGGRVGDDTLWRANVAASNRYEGGKESVGFHSDQLTYLGPYPTIASLSLGTRRNFSLREVIPTSQLGERKAQTFNIPLAHNSLTIMHASCQEQFKHSIPPQPAIDLYRPALPKVSGGPIEPSNCRINITFRFYRPDFRPPSIPRCQCGIPTILRPDMKNRADDHINRYWWTCYAGAQNEGKGCKFWKPMNMKEGGRGPCIESLGDES